VDIVLDELLKKTDSRYSLVIAASKRARQLTADGKVVANKAVVFALREIMHGKIVVGRG